MNETLSSAASATFQQSPFFRIVKSLPDGMAPQIEFAVMDFIKTSHMPQGVDPQGFYRHTLAAIAACSVLGGAGDLWLGTVDGELMTYVIGQITNDIDGRLTYFVSQAWVREDQRGQAWVKRAWETVRQRAKDSLCKHFAISSSRDNDAAYCRFLGRGFHKYISILKEEL